MSAKKKREISEQEMAERELKKQEEAKAAKRTNLTYAVVGFLCVALCATMLVWNSGLIQRNAAALTINGQKYSAADVQYFYSATKSNIINYYLTNLGMLPFDYTASAKVSKYDSQPAPGAQFFVALLRLGRPVFFFLIVAYLIYSVLLLRQLQRLLTLHRNLKEGLPPHHNTEGRKLT